MRVSANPSPEQSPAAADAERAMLVLKKQQDVSKTVSQALLSLIDDTTPSAVGGRLSVYA